MSDQDVGQTNLHSQKSDDHSEPAVALPRMAELGDLHKQAALLSKLPVVSKLLASPETLDRFTAQSPQLAQMMAANPFMKDMLQPQAVSQLLQAAQDPQSLQSLLGEALPMEFAYSFLGAACHQQHMNCVL